MLTRTVASVGSVRFSQRLTVSVPYQITKNTVCKLTNNSVRFVRRYLELTISGSTRSIFAHLHWRHQLWGTGARAPPLELGHVKKIGSFYDNNKH